MPDTKVSALTDGVTANSTDRIPVARDAGGGTFNNRYVTPGYIGTTLLGSDTALTGATVTTSQPVLNLTQTWNDGAVTFTGLRFNATSTASASGSLLLDLQVGGTSQFNVGKTTTNLFTARGHIFSSDADALVMTNSSGTKSLLTRSDFTQIPYAAAYRWGDMSSFAADLFLTRAAAATLQLGAADAAAPVAQTFKVQSVVGSTPGATDVAGANFTIRGSAGRGSGAGGSIIFQVAPAGSAGTGAQNAYATALTIDSTRTAIFAAGATFASAVQGATNIGATNNIFVGSAFNNGTVLIGSAYGGISSVSVGQISWTSSSTNPADTRDLILARDAANTLALRNGTSAQLFRVYSTYNGTNDAYGAIGAGVKLDGTYASGDENILYIGSQKKGSPTALTKLAIQVDGTTRLNYGVTGATTWAFSGTIYSDSAGGAPDLNGWDNKAAIRGSGNYWSLGTSGSPAANAFSLFTYNGGSFSTPAFSVTQSGVPWLCQFTATPASGSANAHVNLGTTSNFGIYYGSGAPTVSAAQGSIYLRSDGSGTSDRMYVNTDGATTWTAVTTAA